jgi:hypothetical protein
MQEKTTLNSKPDDLESVRAEELIVSIYKLKLDLQEKGIVASKIILPMNYYKKIRKYHSGLGEIQGNFGDYITDDEIFGIPVYIDQVNEILVE